MVLAEAVPDAGLLGGEVGLDRKRLIAELAGLATDLRRGYWLRIATVGLVVAGLTGVALRMLDGPLLVASVLTAVSLAWGGSATLLGRINDELAQVRMLLAIAPELTIEALGEIAQKASATL